MPEFLQVRVSIALGVLSSESGVSTLATACAAIIGQFGGVWQGKERLGGVQITVDNALVHSMAGHDGKPCLAERLAKRIAEGLFIGLE